VSRLRFPAQTVVIRRTMDAAFLNEIVNHPEVRPWVGGDGVLDLTPVITNPANLAVVTDTGGFIAVGVGEGRYEIHSMFRPTGHGVVAAMREALTYCFTATDAVELVTKVPVGNKAADGLATLAGFRLQGSVTMPWAHGERRAVEIRTLRIEDWAQRARLATELGHWLHDRFAVVLKSRHSSLPPHSPDDPLHDQMAGAAVAMVRAGNPQKAVLFYNRWASVTGYPGIRILRYQPTVLDLEGIIVEVRGEEIEVLTCR
jgi:hypothetical protein